jgi:hypothetical protein
MAILWLMAALSLVGWLIVNLDTAGWILVLLTTGLMTFELTRRPARVHSSRVQENVGPRGYAVLPLGDGLARLGAGSLPPRAVSITVDDGTYDFHAVAYPVFKRFGIPVTLVSPPGLDLAFRYLFSKAGVSGKAARSARRRRPAAAHGIRARPGGDPRLCDSPASRTGLGQLPAQPRACLDATGGDRNARPS